MTKRTMTPEVRKRLSGLLPFAPGASVPFTPEAFQNEEEATRPIYYVAAFSRMDATNIRNNLMAGTFDDDVVIRALQGSGLVNWFQPSLPDGEEIPFSKEAIANLPDTTLGAVYSFASELTWGPTKEEKEGLQSVLPSTSEPTSKIAPSADVAPN